jgi:transcriptional regulator of stress and heat shock response
LRGSVALMPSLSDQIEDYLRKLLALSSRDYVEIQRGELAGKFSCAPSQINYVLSTRFPLERGYLVEGRRGGGGCIRIHRINPLQVRTWEEVLDKMTAGEFTPAKAAQFLKRSCEDKIISRREAGLVEALLRDEHYAGLNTGDGKVRALQEKLFKAALAAVFKGEH